MKEFRGVKYYNAVEVAERLGITTRTLNRYQNQAEIKPILIGRKKYFVESDIESLINVMIKEPEK